MRSGFRSLSHFELGKLYEEVKRPEEAKHEYERFLEMWADADGGLPQVGYAAKRLVALKE